MPTKKIAFFRNGLGNFICFTPVLQALASLDPSGKVDVCIDGEWRDNRRQSLIDIIAGLPFVETMVNYPEIDLSKKYNTWFWSRHTYPSPALEVFKCKDPRFDIGIAWAHSGLHETEFYMGLARRFCGYEGEAPKQYAPVDEAFIFEKKKRLIVLCNGSYGHLAPSKKWNKFPELAKTLRSWYDCEIAKVGYCDELADVKDFDHDFVGKLNMPQTAKVIRSADLLITTDTCCMHVGDALNVPMVVLWGGSLLSKNRPINGHAAIVNKGYGCQSCHEVGGNGDIMKCLDYKCISTISVGEVMLEVRKALKDD
jgi:ADP-heptose:LPS heptosyltransferase